MKKVTFTMLIILFFATISFGQEKKQNNKQEEQTSFNEFMSEKGVIIKFIENPLPNLRLSYGFATCKIRKVEKEGNIKYYFIISKKTTYDTKTAYIAYDDLIGMIKVLEVLKNEKIKYDTLQPNYMEEKYLTNDGLELGFYIGENKSLWYIQLEKYGRERTIYIKDVVSIEELFNNAKELIEQWKNHVE